MLWTSGYPHCHCPLQRRDPHSVAVSPLQLHMKHLKKLQMRILLYSYCRLRSSVLNRGVCSDTGVARSRSPPTLVRRSRLSALLPATLVAMLPQPFRPPPMPGLDRSTMLKCNKAYILQLISPFPGSKDIKGRSLCDFVLKLASQKCTRRRPQGQSCIRKFGKTSPTAAAALCVP